MSEELSQEEFVREKMEQGLPEELAERLYIINQEGIQYAVTPTGICVPVEELPSAQEKNAELGRRQSPNQNTTRSSIGRTVSRYHH